MLIPGLVSISFRQLSVAEIVALVKKANLESIEWGGDIHVPPGNVESARETRKRTEEAGLSTAAYGSYYRVGKSESDQVPFTRVLESASELNAPTIRVWAGVAGSEQTDDITRQHIVTETRRIADMAAAAGVTISFEFHGNTLTDTNDSCLQLLQEVDHPNVLSLWQPAIGASHEEALDGLHALLPKLTNVHVFSWAPNSNRRLALAEGADRWHEYLETVRSTGRNHHALMEFVRDDSPEIFLEDAAVFRNWIAKTEGALRKEFDDPSTQE